MKYGCIIACFIIAFCYEAKTQSETPVSETASVETIGTKKRMRVYTGKRYYKKNNRFENIRESFTPSKGVYVAKAEQQAIPVLIDKTGKRRIMLSENSYIEFGRIQYITSTGRWVGVPISKYKTENNKTTFTGSQAIISYTNTVESMKMDIVVLRDTTVRGYRYDYTLHNATIDGKSNDSKFIVRSNDGKSISLTRPVIYADATGRLKKERWMNYYLTGTHIEFSGDFSGLKYPVHIDPSVVYSTQPASNMDTFIENQYPTSNNSSLVLLQTGVADDGGSLNLARTLIRFDVSDIPSGSVCLGATLYMTLSFSDNPTLDRGHSVYSIRSDRSSWEYTESTWNEYYTGANWGTAGCSNTSTDYNPTAIGTFNSPTSASEISIPISNTTVSTWFGEANDNYGIMIKQDTETNNFRKREWDSSRSTTASDRPRLVIEYDSAPPAVAQSIIPAVIMIGE